MPNNPNAQANLKPWKPGQSGNPNGLPKGTKHLSTWIQELMHDEEFTALIRDPKEGYKEYKGAPVKAVVAAQLNLAVQGEVKSADWLAKYGWGSKIELDTPDIEIKFTNKVPEPDKE